MSIFSKLFPGGAKGEGDTLPSATPSVDALEEGPKMKRPPNEGKSAEAARPDPEGHKLASATQPRGSGVRAQVGAAPVRAPGPARAPSPDPSTAMHTARTNTSGGSAGRPVGAPAPSARARSSPPPRAPREEAAHKLSQAPSMSPGPGSYAAVSASRLHSPPSSPAPARDESPGSPRSPKAAEGVAPVVHRSRPEMPAAAPPRTSAEPPKGSVRPSPLEAERSNGGSIADTFERLLSSELDAGFESMQQPSHAPAPRAPAGADLGEVKALFAQLAANHVRAVRDFVIDLRWSDATVEWVTICSPALQSLRRAADKLELEDLCQALDKFSEVLVLAQSDPGRAVGGERRVAILAAYDELSRLMPQAFALDMDQTQRESVILQSLLLQVPDVKKVTLDKMYAAGLSTLEAMLLATAEDIAATTGVAEVTAQRIVERFRAYRAHVKATAPDAARSRERQHIADLTSRLRREHDAYERISQSWSREAADQKKELRRVRAQTLLDIQVELARLGEVERLSQIERLPFEGKLTELETFLEDARDKYVAQP